jgi:hypothetical protein
MPTRASSARAVLKRRRQNVLLTFMGSMFACGIVYVGLGIGLFLPLALFFLFCTIAYMVLLVRLRQAEDVRSSNLWWQQAA